jgi:hypothetical protein
MRAKHGQFMEIEALKQSSASTFNVFFSRFWWANRKPIAMAAMVFSCDPTNHPMLIS